MLDHPGAWHREKGQSMHTIYLVRKDDEPVYVGYTSRSIEKRWNKHIKDSTKTPKYPLHHAIKKHGVSAFTIETLYESEDGKHTLNYMEHHYIWLYRTHWENGGYNLSIGGEGGGKGLTDKERRARINARNKAWRKVNKDIVNARNRAWYKANKDKVKATKNAYRQANKEKVADRQKSWYEANQDKVRGYEKVWRDANRDKIRAYREARKMQY